MVDYCINPQILGSVLSQNRSILAHLTGRSNRANLNFDRVCVSSEPVEGLFEVSVGVDFHGDRADRLRFDRDAQRVVAAELAPLAEVLRQNDFPVRINSKPCFEFFSTAGVRPPRVRRYESD